MSEQIPVRSGLFRQNDDGTSRLLGGRCRTCGRHHFPRFDTCPYCSSDDTVDAELSGEGTLWGWTAVAAAPPGYSGAVPFGFGVVELPERLRVVARLTEPDPMRLRFGQRMRCTVDPLHVDEEGRTVVGYAFEPVTDPS